MREHLKRVMLVTNNRQVRELFASVNWTFERDCETTVFSCGETAVSLVGIVKPDAIIVAHPLQGNIDGPAFARAVQLDRGTARPTLYGLIAKNTPDESRWLTAFDGHVLVYSAAPHVIEQLHRIFNQTLQLAPIGAAR